MKILSIMYMRLIWEDSWLGNALQAFVSILSLFSSKFNKTHKKLK